MSPEAIPLFTVRENNSDLIAGNNLERCPTLKREKKKPFWNIMYN